jgi:hypothetical protein
MGIAPIGPVLRKIASLECPRRRGQRLRRLGVPHRLVSELLWPMNFRPVSGSFWDRLSFRRRVGVIFCQNRCFGGLSLSEIKSRRIDGANFRGVGWATILSDRTDEVLRMSVPPWRSRCDRPVLNAHRANATDKDIAIDTIPIGHVPHPRVLLHGNWQCARDASASVRAVTQGGTRCSRLPSACTRSR